MTKPNQTNTGKWTTALDWLWQADKLVWLHRQVKHFRLLLLQSLWPCLIAVWLLYFSNKTSDTQPDIGTPTRLTCIASMLVRAMARSIVFSVCPSVCPSVPPLLSQYLCDGSREFYSKFEPTTVLWTKVKHRVKCYLPTQRFLQWIRQLNHKCPAVYAFDIFFFL